MAELLKGLWSFILGCLRLIFVAICLIYILVQVHGFREQFREEKKDPINLPGLYVTNTDRLQSFITLMAAVFGAYGGIFNNKASLKLFAYMTALNSAALMVRLHYSSKSLPQENEEFFKAMNGLAADYDWTKEKGENLENRAWDYLQNMRCCGSVGPADWNKFRPKSLYSHLYPASCCITPAKYCADTYTLGCAEMVVVEQIVLLKFKLGYVLAQIGFFLLACLFINCQPSFSNSQRVHVNPSHVYVSTQVNGQSNRPVNMRQPPYNEQMIPLDGPRKSNPLYPELNMSDRNQPPPSYGSGY